MMKKTLPTFPRFRVEIVGKKVVRAEQDADGLGLQFEDGWNITIWTKCTLLSEDGNENLDFIGTLEGATLTMFVGNNHSEILSFDNWYELLVDLETRNESACEQIAIYGPNNLLVVWE